MLVPQLLLETLEELGDQDFLKFKWYLSLNVLNSRTEIAKCYLESPHRHVIVSKVIESYGEEMAVNVTVEILKRMNHNNSAENLKRTYAGGSTAAQNPLPAPSSSSSSSGLTPAAGATVCAQGQSVIVAPNIQGTSSGVSISMNINTK